MAAQNEKIALLDGAGASPIEHHAGAVRFRLLPAGTPIAGLASDNTLWPLQVSAEPHPIRRRSWPCGSRKRSMPTEHRWKQPRSSRLYANNDQVVFLPMANGLVRTQSGGAGVAALRLIHPDKTAKSIRLITGEVSAQLR